MAAPELVQPAQPAPPCLCGHEKSTHQNFRDRCNTYTNGKTCSCHSYVVLGSSLHQILNFVRVMEDDGRLVDRIDQQVRIDQANQHRRNRIVGMD